MIKSDELNKVSIGEIVKRVIVQSILFLFCIESYALPGMSDIVFDYSLNDKLFSSSALKCRNLAVNDKGLDNLVSALGKFNCNAIKEPEEFCQCVDAISADGITLSEDERDRMSKLLFEETLEDLFTATENSIVSTDDFQNMKIGFALVPSAKICFEGRYNTYGLLKEKEKSGEPLTLSEQLQKRVYNKLESFVPKNENIVENLNNKKQVSRTFQVIREGIEIELEKYKGLYDSKKDKEDILKGVVADFDYSKIEGNSPLTSLKHLSDRDDMLYDLIEREFVREGAQPFANTGGMAGLMASGYLGGINQEHIRNTENDRLLERVTHSACGEVTAAIKKIGKIDFKKEVRNIKNSVFRPKTEDDHNLIAMIEDKMLKEMQSNNKNISKSELQEKLFNIDLMYCSERKKINFRDLDPNEEKKVQEVLAKIEEIDTIRKNESKRLARLEAENAKDQKVLTEKAIVLGQLNSQVAIMEAFLSGDYAKDGVFGNDIDYQDPSFLNLFIGLNDDNKTYKSMVAQGKKQRYHPMPASQKDSLIAKISGLKEVIKKDELALNEKVSSFSSRYSSIEELRISVKELGNKQAALEVRAQNIAGKDRADAMLSDLDRRTNKSTGTVGASSMMTRHFSPKSSRRERLKEFFSSKGDSQSKEKYLDKIDSKVSTSKAISAFNNGKVEKVTTGAKPSESVFKSATKSVNANPFAQKQTLSNKNMKVNSLNNPVVNIKSNRELELEKSLKRLEDIISNQSNATSAKSAQAAKDAKEIDTIKADIEMQKLLAEKDKIAREIADLNKVETVKPQITTKAPAAKDFSRPSSVNTFSGVRSPIRSSSSRSSAQAPTSSDSRSNVSSSSATPSAVTSNTQSAQASSGTSNPRSSDSSSVGSRGLALTRGEGSSSFEVDKVSGNESIGDSRIVRVDFEIDSLPANEREELFKSLFLSGEDSIVIETPEGEKLVVKNTEDLKAMQENLKEETIVGEKEEAPVRRHKKMTHEELIKILKVGSANEDQ